MKNEITVIIDDGRVDCVYADKPEDVDVTILDYDSDKDDYDAFTAMIAKVSGTRIEPEILHPDMETANMLFREFLEQPLDNEAHALLRPWRHFLAGTRDTYVKKWFEDTFHAKVSQTLVPEDD